MKTMRIFPVLLVAAAGVVAGPLSAHAAKSTKVISLSGSYTGTASLLIDNSSVKILSVKGSGASSVLGAGSITGTGNGGAANGQCVPFTGTGVIKGKAGTIKFSVNQAKSTGCSSGQSGPVTVTINGIAKVNGGTGKTKGAKGNLKFKGTLDLKDTSGSQSGTFSGHVSGKLTVRK